MSYQFRAATTADRRSIPVSAGKLEMPHRAYRDGLKRAFDIAVVLMVSVPVLVVVGIMAALAALDGHNPFYLQKRVGLDGREFKIFKLRTMVHDADDVFDAYLRQNPEAKAEWDEHQKLRNDPRITKVGRILRKTSLDELPQLLNVLFGDMSIVGPRPMMCSQRALYPGTEYYAMRPGITGFWQISVRNDSSFRERAQFDRSYYQQLSFLTDLTVMFKTVKVVVRGTGC